MNIFVHPQEIWSKAKCEKIAKTFHRDGLGTKDSKPGRIASVGSSYPQYGQKVRYNGGCIRNGTWYDGESIPLPIIPKGFAFETVCSWGIYLVKK